MRQFVRMQQLLSARALLAIAIMAASGAAADTSGDAPPPPLPPFEDLGWTAKVATQPAARLTLGQFQVIFERTQLGEVAAAAGGAIAHRGDAGNSIRWLCYDLDGRRRRQRIWIVSGGEMGGRDQLITGIVAGVVKAGPRAPHSADLAKACPALPVTLLPVTFNNGVWLGMPVTSLAAMFGAPPGTLGSWSGYRYEHRGDGTCKPNGFDVLNSLQWQSAGGVVTAIDAGQVSSC